MWTHLEGKVRHLLDEVAYLWNQGKLEESCLCYADDATCIGPYGYVRGKDDILKFYKKLYPSPADMGRLTFEVLEYREGGVAYDALASAVIKWTVENEDETFSGWTLEIFRAQGGRLKIIQAVSIQPPQDRTLGAVVENEPVLQA